MKIYELDQIEELMHQRYGDKAKKYPDSFDELIPKPAIAGQIADVQSGIQQLTGCNCSVSLENLFARWDFTNLNVAGFSFGFKGSFAQRLIENNREDVINAWWEDAFDQRPKTQLFVAQGDPYVIIVDVQTDAVSAYPASDGAHTAKNIAGDLATCLRALVSVQVYKPSAPTDSLTIADIRDALGADCDEQFWTEQIRHWSEFN